MAGSTVAVSAAVSAIVTLVVGTIVQWGGYDLVRDLVEDLTSFCARLYGRRSARHRAEKALHAATADDVQAL